MSLGLLLIVVGLAVALLANATVGIALILVGLVLLLVPVG